MGVQEKNYYSTCIKCIPSIVLYTQVKYYQNSCIYVRQVCFVTGSMVIITKLIPVVINYIRPHKG